MYCRPGMILNPETLRCVKTTSHIARDLVRRGVIADYLVPVQPRKTMRRYNMPAPCRPDQERNPLTGRCKKINRKTYRQPVYQNMRQPVYQNPYQHPVKPQLYPITKAYQNPRQVAFDRRQLSEPSEVVPRGTATVAPIGATMDWIRGNCRNSHDPLTGSKFSHINPYELQNVVRLHDKTCVAAQPLHYKVAAEHSNGQEATLPSNPGRVMSTADFNALRTAMRRRNPGYKIPTRKQQSEWKQQQQWQPRWF